MVKKTTDYAMIEKMLKGDKELFERMSDDYTKCIKYDPSDSDWLGWYDGDECQALMSVHPETSIVLIVHIHIPKKFRGKDSYKMGNELLRYVETTCNERFVKINAKIPAIYMDVTKFAQKNGFMIEGIDRHSFIKNGRIYDRLILGKIIER